MPYALQGFIARDPATVALLSARGRTVQLPQGYVLLPLGMDILSELGVPFLAFDEADRPGQFMNIDSLGIEFSLKGKAAYVEVVDIGGRQYQGAIAWSNGEVTLERTMEPGAIDLALNALGVDVIAGKDFFTALKLDRFKSSDEWLKS